MDMEADAKHGVYWPGFVALGAATFAIFNFLTRWLLPGETCVVCPESTRSTHLGQPVPTQIGPHSENDEVTVQIAAILKYSLIIIFHQCYNLHCYIPQKVNYSLSFLVAFTHLFVVMKEPHLSSWSITNHHGHVAFVKS